MICVSRPWRKVCVIVWKPATRFWASSDQPSTSTNSSSLNGSEIIAGGSIIMPIDIRVDATTRSMIRNGM